MRIAVACEGKTITGHFGHCETFMYFDTDNGKVVNIEGVPNPGHRPGFLPKFLSENNVNVIISGGMGGGAVDLFNEYGIEVIIGSSGDAAAAVEAYLAGELKSTGSICHDHNHE
ncbi:MAG: NifB/NifX family molybdenum-iron cluster-binding protein [Clostridia bacterium]